MGSIFEATQAFNKTENYNRSVCNGFSVDVLVNFAVDAVTLAEQILPDYNEKYIKIGRINAFGILGILINIVFCMSL